MKSPMRYLPLTLVLGLCWLLMPVPVAAQATVVSVDPEDKADEVTVIRFASANSVPIERGMELQPGDLVQAASTEVLVELRCANENEDAPTDYLLSAQFGAIVGVTEGKMCRMIMLRGNMDVLGSEKTQTDAGEVSMISQGTQYAIRLGSAPDSARVRFRSRRPQRRISVFDGRVDATLGEVDVRISTGRSYTYTSGIVGSTLASASAADIESTVEVYTRTDLYRAAWAGVVIDNEQVEARLKRLHAAVLRDPKDKTKRVNLAKAQIEYKGEVRAMYNLKRVNIDSPRDLERYQINPQVLENAQLMVVTLNTDQYLGLIDQGRIDEAIQGLNRRIEENQANSRDYYALAKAYDLQGNLRQGADTATQALTLHRRDGALSQDEIDELTVILRKAPR